MEKYVYSFGGGTAEGDGAVATVADDAASARATESRFPSQTNFHCEFSALLVGSPARAGAKMANTRGKILNTFRRN
jgi:hypothetical protein